jgi:tetratricopeptide (TPR) repeat protein
MKKIGEAYIKTHAYSKAVKYYEAIIKAEPQSELRLDTNVEQITSARQSCRISLAELLSKLNQIDQTNRLLEQLLREEGDRIPMPMSLSQPFRLQYRRPTISMRNK